MDSVETGEEHSIQERTSTKFDLPLPSTVKRMTDETISSLLRPFTILAKWMRGLCEIIVKLEYVLAICLSLRALALRPSHFEHKYLSEKKGSRFVNRSLPSCISWKSFAITNLPTCEITRCRKETTRLSSQREPSASSITLLRLTQFVGVCH